MKIHFFWDKKGWHWEADYNLYGPFVSWHACLYHYAKVCLGIEMDDKGITHV